MLHRGCNGSVFLATPAYAGVEPGYVFALYESVKLLERYNIKTELALYANDCHVDDSRNALVKRFLETDCEQLVFLDSDVRWEAEDLNKLIGFQEDVVGGTYPLKQEEEGYPVMMGEAKKSGELYEVEALPTGFLKIRRNVLERMASIAPKYFGKKDATPTPLIFERTMVDGVRWGGDTTFCRKWKEMGGKIHLYPSPLMEHTGSRTWSGRFSAYMRGKEIGAIPAAIEAVRDGRVDSQAFLNAAREYGNPYVASPTFYATLMQAKGKVLECGSGLSTLFMAANGCDVWCLEHDIQWAKATGDMANALLTDEESSRIHIVLCPLKDGWYDVKHDLPDFDVMVVDGPPRASGDRSGAARMLPKVRGMVVTDDGFTGLPLDFTRIDNRVCVARSQ